MIAVKHNREVRRLFAGPRRSRRGLASFGGAAVFALAVLTLLATPLAGTAQTTGLVVSRIAVQGNVRQT